MKTVKSFLEEAMIKKGHEFVWNTICNDTELFSELLEEDLSDIDWCIFVTFLEELYNAHPTSEDVKLYIMWMLLNSSSWAGLQNTLDSFEDIENAANEFSFDWLSRDILSEDMIEYINNELLSVTDNKDEYIQINYERFITSNDIIDYNTWLEHSDDLANEFYTFTDNNMELSDIFDKYVIADFYELLGNRDIISIAVSYINTAPKEGLYVLGVTSHAGNELFNSYEEVFILD